MSRVPFTVIACLSAGLCFGQTGLITGRVEDPDDRAIPGAKLTLYTRGSPARTAVAANASGEYRFDRVSPGDYILEVEAAGFARFIAENVHVDRDARIARDVRLQLAGIQQEIVVTASGTPQTIDEVSKAITVVDQKSIDIRDEFQFSEAVRPTPGLRVQQLGGPGSFTAIRIRGLRDQDTAVLIDGMRLRDAGATQGDASGLIEDLLVTDIDRVEILRGSGSSLYGTNAIGGVINIITQPGGGPARGNILLEGGSLGLFRGRAQFTGGLNHDRVEYSAGVADLNVTSGLDGDSPARKLSGHGRVAFRLAPSTQLIARFYGIDSFAKVKSGPETIGDFPGAGIVSAIPLSLSLLRRYEAGAPVSQLMPGAANFIPSADDPDASRSGRFFSGALALVGRLSRPLGYSIGYQGLSTARTFRDGPAGVGFQPAGSIRSDFDGQLQTVNARVDYQLGAVQLLSGGYEFEDEKFGTFSAARLNPGAASKADVTQRSNAVFVQDQARLLDGRLQISGAFRAQAFSLQRPRFVPEATAPYQAASFPSPPPAHTGDGSIAYFLARSGTKFRAHAGRGYRAPSLFERFGTGFDQDFGYTVYGDPRLRPEHSIAFDFGIDQTFWGQRALTSATYFYTRLQDVILFDFSGLIHPLADPFGRSVGYVNSQGGLARGLELSAQIAATRSLDVSAAYTYTNAIERAPIVGDVLRSFLVPRHQVSIVATQRLGRRLFISFDLTASSSYVGEVFGNTTAALLFDGIKKADLGASYRIPFGDFKAVRFFVKAANLLNQTYYESGFRTPGITGVGGLQVEF